MVESQEAQPVSWQDSFMRALASRPVHPEDDLDIDLEVARIKDLESYVHSLPDDDPSPYNALLDAMDWNCRNPEDFKVVRAALISKLGKGLIWRDGKIAKQE